MEDERSVSQLGDLWKASGGTSRHLRGKWTYVKHLAHRMHPEDTQQAFWRHQETPGSTEQARGNLEAK